MEILRNEEADQEPEKQEAGLEFSTLYKIGALILIAAVVVGYYAIGRNRVLTTKVKLNNGGGDVALKVLTGQGTRKDGTKTYALRYLSQLAATQHNPQRRQALAAIFGGATAGWQRWDLAPSQIAGASTGFVHPHGKWVAVARAEFSSSEPGAVLSDLVKEWVRIWFDVSTANLSCQSDDLQMGENWVEANGHGRFASMPGNFRLRLSAEGHTVIAICAFQEDHAKNPENDRAEVLFESLASHEIPFERWTACTENDTTLVRERLSWESESGARRRPDSGDDHPFDPCVFGWW